MDTYLKIKINQIRGAKLRNMDTSADDALYGPMSVRDFERYLDYNRNPRDFKTKLNADYLELNPTPGEKVKALKVIYINKSDAKTVPVATMKEVVAILNAEKSRYPDRDYSAYVIGQVALSNPSRDIINTYPDLDITYFEEIELGYFAKDSDLSPEYEVLTPEKKADVIKYYKIKNEVRDFAWILTDEQIVKLSGWKPGTLVRIVRTEPEMSLVDQTFNYRLVVQASGK